MIARIMPQVRLDGSELLDHLMLDMVWKAVIVAAAVVIVAVAMVVLWRVLGRRR